ncbi:aldo/keto reductase [Asticcacaulis sp. EMRT-3]|uniref:aldo/keto reductase n=1 Tax=Asticcacaulis sp. EMRT-3 TaxID=3040349 RepID=UPI0024AF9A02|nr:aldo/keto reductase [Asticcacaulis sp. EMRT-3]MDI7774104.1 aldo/keto reductase [Asticcacaulis sp. EMRT-3]
MRYRPFGRSGIALSTVGLRLSQERLGQNRNLMQKLVVAALENGINTYHFDSTSPEFLRMAADVFGVVERKLLFISVNAHDPGQAADYSLAPLKERLRSAIKDSGLHWLDLLMFASPGALDIPPESFDFLKSLQKARMLRHIGARGATGDIPALIESGRFSVIETSFDIDSSWDKRRQIDRAVQHEMNVIASDFFPEAYRKATDVVPKAARGGWFAKPKNPLAGMGTHSFLHQTADWTPEALCLGYALSQPTLSCVFIDADTPEQVEALAEVPERHLPSSVPAQIEMARFNEPLANSGR